MTHEEMIEEARKAVHAAIPGSGPYDSWLPARSLGSDFLGDIAKAAFAVFEKAQAPTDDEREEIVRVIGGHVDLPVSSRLVIARSILAAGFRRPTQTEPTDAQVEAALAAYRGALSNFTWDRMRAALAAALTAGKQEYGA